MITDILLELLGNLLNFFVNLLPSFDFLDNVVKAHQSFLNFISEYLPYVLYFFNIDVLKIALGLLLSYITFIVSEYFIKLIVKYVTRLF